MDSHCGNSRRCSSQRGQTFLAIVIFIAVFLLAVLGLATDYTQVWAHRQMAQGAADAACQAAAADLFLNAVNPSASGQNGLQSFSWIGSPFDCSTNASSPPCSYAALNGYSGSKVSVTFPSSLTGVGSLPSGFGAIANPYVQVKITDPVPMSFTKIVSKTGTVNITAAAGCGLNPVAVPIPLVVLHQTAASSLSTQGSGGIQILGGPPRSIQVDSGNSAAVNVGGSSTIDLTQAGPNGTGADFGVFGNESQPAGVLLGAGKWISPSTPFGDPWATVTAPTLPSTAGTAKPVPFAINGCPDPAGCVEFTGGTYTSCSSGTLAPGDNGCLVFPYSGGTKPQFSVGAANWQANHAYSIGDLILPTTPTCTSTSNPGKFVYQAMTAGVIPSGAICPASWNQIYGQNTVAVVTWKNVGVVSTKPNTAIFDPGLYYLGAKGLTIGDNSTVRMSTPTGDGNSGATFYFSTSNTVTVGSNAGKFQACTSVNPSSGTGVPSTSGGCIVSYKIDGTASTAATGSILSRPLQCSAAGSPPNPTQVPSLIDGNILLGPCSGTFGDPTGRTRGFVFFQNRATAATASWGGGAGSLVSGFMYFHNTSFGSLISMSGGSSSAALSLGNMVADKVTLVGGSGIKMILNPQVAFQVLRPTLLQ